MTNEQETKTEKRKQNNKSKVDVLVIIMLTAYAFLGLLLTSYPLLVAILINAIGLSLFVYVTAKKWQLPTDRQTEAVNVQLLVACLWLLIS